MGRKGCLEIEGGVEEKEVEIGEEESSGGMGGGGGGGGVGIYGWLLV